MFGTGTLQQKGPMAGLDARNVTTPRATQAKRASISDFLGGAKTPKSPMEAGGIQKSSREQPAEEVPK
jgi:hypothetical protein